MSKKVRKSALPHELRLAKIDGFGRVGKYYYAGEECGSNSVIWLSMLVGLMSAWR